MTQTFECEEGKEIELAVNILLKYFQEKGTDNPKIELELHIEPDELYELTFERKDIDLINQVT